VPSFGEEQDSTESRARRALQNSPQSWRSPDCAAGRASYARSPAWGDGGLPGLGDYRLVSRSVALEGAVSAGKLIEGGLPPEQMWG